MFINITGHSGCNGTKRDSIDSIIEAIKAGADIVEIDVRRDTFGNLILSHDKQNLEEYKQCYLVKDAFKIIRDSEKIRVNCDIKENDEVDQLFELAEEFGIEHDKLFLSGSISTDLLKRESSIMNKAQILWNVEEAVIPFIEPVLIERGMEDQINLLHSLPWQIIKKMEIKVEDYLDMICNQAVQLNISTLNMPYTIVTEANLEIMRKNNLKASVWTVNDSDEIIKMLKMHVFNITTLEVNKALKLRGEYLQNCK